MKTLKHIYFIAFIMAFVFSSCKIEKRIYMSGYNIAWNKATKNNYGHKFTLCDNKKTERQNISIPVELSSKETNSNEKAYSNNNITAALTNNEARPSKKEKINCFINQKNKQLKYDSEPTDEPKNNFFAIASYVFGLLSFSVFFTIITVPLAIIFGLIALHQIKKNPEKYKGEHMAQTGLKIGFFILFISSIIGIMVLFALWLFTGNIIFLGEMLIAGIILLLLVLFARLYNLFSFLQNPNKKVTL